MSKKHKSFYISRRFDIRLGMEITAASFEDALDYARKMTVTDFLTMDKATQFESVDDLPGLGVSENDQ